MLKSLHGPSTDIKFKLVVNPALISGCCVPSNTLHFELPKLFSLYKLCSLSLLNISYVDLQYEIDYLNCCARAFLIDYTGESRDS